MCHSTLTLHIPDRFDNGSSLPHPVLQTATIRILIGMAMAALQNFSTGLEPDLALLSGSSSSSSESGQSQEQQQQQELTPEMRTALVFRSQRKQLLLDVISVLAEKLKQVSSVGVCDVTIVPVPCCTCLVSRTRHVATACLLCCIVYSSNSVI
jgi:hypothetical protein